MDRRSSRSRHRRAPPAVHRAAGSGSARRSARGGRRAATPPRGRIRCSAEIGRPDARRSGRPGVVSWRIPRHSSSASSPPSPAGSSAGGRIAHLRRHRMGPDRRLLRPVRLDRASIPCMVSLRPSCKPASRRQRRRRLGDRRRPRGNGANAAKAVAVAIPLFLFLVIALLGVAGASASVAAYTYLSRDLEDPKQALDDLGFTQQTTVYDRTGDVQLARLGDDRREVVTFAEIPPALIDATTSIEDKTFWENSGFDPAGFVAAAIDTIQGRDRGGSTITQQLVRARLLPPSAFEGSVYERKAKEIIQSIRLTEAYPGEAGKQTIIEKYLNQNFYGNRSYGVAAAARSYWHKDLKDLSPRPDGDPRRHPPVPHPVRPRQERDRGDVQGQQGRRAGAPRGAADERDRPAPQLHPRPDEDPQRPDQGRLHRRGLRGRQDRARHPRLPDRRPVARPPVRLAGALRARPDPVRRRRATARRSTPAATRS